jgi:hypothetical protein
MAAVGLALMAGSNPVRATLEKYDFEIGRDRESGLPYTCFTLEWSTSCAPDQSTQNF